jgi:hypothetical protein
VSTPPPVAAREDDVPEPELPESREATDADVAGSVVVVVPGAVVVVDVGDVVGVGDELGVVVEGDVVGVVVGVVAAALGVTVQQELKVCGTPGAAALSPALLAEVEYSQSACTLRDAGELMHEDGKLRLYSFVARSNETVTPFVLSQRVVKGELPV